MNSEHTGELVVALAFGCLHFRYADEAPFTLTGEQYQSTLEAALADIPAVDDLRIELDDDFLAQKFDVEVTPGPIRMDLSFFPFSQLGKIAFTLQIPDRVQRDILGYSNLHTETFWVCTEWNYSMPVSMIVPLDPEDEPDPSQAVVLVRQFLQRELRKGRDGHIELDVLGPSPSHSDVFLRSSTNPRPAGSPAFIRRGFSRPGYQRYEFEFPPRAYRDPMEAAEAFFAEAAHEMDTFYAIAQARQFLMYQFESIDEAMSALIEKRRERGFKVYLQSVFQTGRMLTNLTIDLVEFQSMQAGLSQNLITQRNNTFVGRQGLFAEAVKEQLEQWREYPTAEYSGLLEQFEARRVTDRELIFGLGGTLLGAAIGLLVGG